MNTKKNEKSIHPKKGKISSKRISKHQQNSKVSNKTKRTIGDKQTQKKQNKLTNNKINTRKQTSKKKINQKKNSRKQTSKKKNNKKKINQKKQIGAGIFDGIFGAKKIGEFNYGVQVHKAVQSETALIKQYKAYAKESEKYFNILEQHNNNLAMIDSILPNVNSFSETFNSILLPEHITKEHALDPSNPLLLSQYLINEYSSPFDITRAHVMQQIRYCLYKYFEPKDRILFSAIEINLKEDGIHVDFIINNYNKVTQVIEHKDYTLNMVSLKALIQAILDDTNDRVKFKPEIVVKKVEKTNPMLVPPALNPDGAEKAAKIIANKEDGEEKQLQLPDILSDDTTDDDQITSFLGMMPKKEIVLDDDEEQDT